MEIACGPEILMMLMPPVPAGEAMAAIVAFMEFNGRPRTNAGGLDLRPSTELLLGVILLADRKNIVDQPVQHQPG